MLVLNTCNNSGKTEDMSTYVFPGEVGKGTLKGEEV